MLSIKTKDGWLPITVAQNAYVEKNEEGDETLSFDVPVNSEIFTYLKAEAEVRTDDNLYLIKSVNKLVTQATITCELNLDDWKESYYLKTVDIVALQTKTIGDVLNYIKPAGWTVKGAEVITIKRTPDKEKCNGYDVLMRCKMIYDVQYDFDCLNKIVTVVDPYASVDTGLYVTPELNMKDHTYKESSTGLVTRLYCYGADDLTFADINNGKSYIDLQGYKGRPIVSSWTDGRYTNKESLMEDGQKKLKNLAAPVGSYTINMLDLAAVDDKYKDLQVRIRETAHCIIDPARDIEVPHRIVKIRKYLLDEDKVNNVITLSNEPRKLTDMMTQMQESIEDNTQSGYKHETIIRNSSKEIELIAKGLGEVKLKLTDEQIMMIISTAINGGNALETVQAILDKTGMTIKNGGIKIYDGQNNLVMHIDQNTKKLVFSGEIRGSTITGDTTINVGTNLYVGNSIYMNTTKRDDYKVISFGNGYISYSKNDSSNFRNLYLTSDGDGSEASIGVCASRNEAYITLTAKGSSGDKMYYLGSAWCNLPATSTSCKNLDVDGYITVKSSVTSDSVSTKTLYCSGSKHRVVEDFYEGRVLMNAVESADPVFEDYGTAQLNEKGVCVIRLDKRFLSTVNASEPYFTFLTQLGPGDLYVKNKYNFAFVVHGSPGLKFDWRVTIKQRGYENERMKEYEKGGNA